MSLVVRSIARRDLMMMLQGLLRAVMANSASSIIHPHIDTMGINYIYITGHDSIIKTLGIKCC